MLSLLLLFLSQSIVSINIAIAVHASEDGPEYDKDRKTSATVESLNWDHFNATKWNKSRVNASNDSAVEWRENVNLHSAGWSVFFDLYLYCLFAEAGLMLVARSLGKARNSSPSAIWLFSLRCTWSRVLLAQRTAARAILWQWDSLLDWTWGRDPVGLVTAGVMPVEEREPQTGWTNKDIERQTHCWFWSFCWIKSSDIHQDSV